MPDTLYDALYNGFKIKRVIHCNPLTLPLRAKEYISHDPKDAVFGALPYTRIAWPDASLVLSAYKAEQLTTVLAQASYIAHAHRHTQPSSRILILPNWQHSTYLARDLHSSDIQKLISIPYLHTQNTHKTPHNTRLNIYLVANEKALRLLDQDYVTHTLNAALSRILGQELQLINLNLNFTDPTHPT
jgi:hypothetical protein